MSETAVNAQDIITLSKREGFLAKQLYVIFTTPTNGIKPVMDNIKEHLAFHLELEKDGTMFAAGPNWTKKSARAIRCTKAVHESSRCARGLSTKARFRCASTTPKALSK